MVAGFLLGNSSLQYCLFDGLDDGDPLRSVGRVGWTELDSRRDELTSLWTSAEKGVVGSVRDDLLPRLEACLPPGRRLLLAGRDAPVPIENRYDRPEEVGLDRLLNALAAWHRAGGPGSGAIAVDFGTTVSISVVSPDGAFLGGAIASGLNSAAAGLSARAPVLPAVELRDRPVFLGRSTEAGLRAGLYWQTVGGVSHILDGLFGELEFVPRVYATGGDALLLAPSVEGIDEIVPELTLEGLRLVYRTHVEGDR